MPEGIFTMNTFLEPAPLTSAAQDERLRRLRARYPFVYCKTLTVTAGGRRVYALQIGQGDTKVLLTAGHHANEYITSMLCWELLEGYLHALTRKDRFGGEDAGALYHNAMLYAVPMVNPDGVDLVTGAIAEDSAEYRTAQQIAARFPEIPFPLGWKANLRGVDLNLNYPAGWETARQLKAARGFCGPAPRDYPGAHPLDQPETSALAAYTCCIRPDLVLAYHTQGGVIYHTYGESAPPQAQLLAEEFSALSGYALEPVPPESANAGFKDWFLQRFCRPGFTIEAGRGENPLPLAQLPELYAQNVPLLAHALAQ